MYEQAAAWIKEADALLFTTGAGMGVASGIGTFRGVNAGVWPPLEKRGIDFSEMSCPRQFEVNERFAWSFWNFRYACYTGNEPHKGYHILREWGEKKPAGYFCFTSNIDGHWEAAKVPSDRVYECHGSVRFMQCQRRDKACPLYKAIWPTDPSTVLSMEIDPETDAVSENSELPKCSGCGKTARPNVLMFGDYGVVHERIDGQSDNYKKWKGTLSSIFDCF